MSIRTKVLVFVGVALGLVSSAGAGLYQSASRAQELRLQLAAVDSQLDVYAALRQQAWRYLGHLLQAGRVGNDSRLLLHEHEQFLQEMREKLHEGLHAEQGRSWSSQRTRARRSSLTPSSKPSASGPRASRWCCAPWWRARPPTPTGGGSCSPPMSRR